MASSRRVLAATSVMVASMTRFCASAAFMRAWLTVARRPSPLAKLASSEAKMRAATAASRCANPATSRDEAVSTYAVRTSTTVATNVAADSKISARNCEFASPTMASRFQSQSTCCPSIAKTGMVPIPSGAPMAMLSVGFGGNCESRMMARRRSSSAKMRRNCRLLVIAQRTAASALNGAVPSQASLGVAHGDSSASLMVPSVCWMRASSAGAVSANVGPGSVLHADTTAMQHMLAAVRIRA